MKELENPTLLRKKPMFRLSMSSLELFHSNFLEWLFDINHKAFLKCFGLKVNNSSTYTIKREYHLGTTLVNGKNKQWVTDIAVFENGNLILIIENKIKSTPSKGQLENQSTFAGTAKRVLLSLFEYSVIEDKLYKFCKVLYKDLIGEIRKHYALSNLYIKDYCDMLERLQDILDHDQLVKDWREGCYTAHLRSPDLETCGIMDAFRKYQAASLADEFENRFIAKNTTGLAMTCEHSLNNKHACTTIAYKLNDRLNVGVQIEYDQLRIFFKDKNKGEKFNIDKAQEYWEEWLKKPLGKGKNQKEYCSYSESFIYRYVKLKGIITTDELCNRVEELLNKIIAEYHSGKIFNVLK